MSPTLLGFTIIFHVFVCGRLVSLCVRMFVGSHTYGCTSTCVGVGQRLGIFLVYLLRRVSGLAGQFALETPLPLPSEFWGYRQRAMPCLPDF